MIETTLGEVIERGISPRETRMKIADEFGYMVDVASIVGREVTTGYGLNRRWGIYPDSTRVTLDGGICPSCWQAAELVHTEYEGRELCRECAAVWEDK